MTTQFFNWKSWCFLVLAVLGTTLFSQAQCPTAAAVITKTHTNISCFGANDGTITVELGNGDAPLNFELYDNIIGDFVTFSVTETNDPDANGNFRKVRYSNLPPSSYQVVVFKAGCPTIQISEGPTGFVVEEPAALQITLNSIDPDCDPASGGASADGNVDLTISGGRTPYDITWTSGPTSIPNANGNTDPFNVVANNVDGGGYTINVVDASGCATSLNIDVPIATVPDAGPDQGLCNVTSATLAANAPGPAEVGKWTVVSGSGTFADDTDPNTTVSGLTIGASSTFRWTITDNNTPALCPGNPDDVVISVATLPTPADAGPDQVICGTAATLAANTPVVGTGAWSITSGAGGTFADATNPASGFTGVAGTTYVLRWTVTNGGCAPSEDDVTITFDATPTPAAAGPDQVVCATTTALAANTPVTGTGAWTIISGTGGNIAAPTNPNSSFTGVAGQIYVLRWTITNASCPATSDEVTIQFDQPPTNPNAGPNQNVCGTSVTLAANTPTVGTGTWSIISGLGGSFGDPSVPNTSFSGVQGNTYILRWTITNGTCPVRNDDVQIRLAAPPTVANAGPDQQVCSTTTSLAGNVAVVGSGAWSIISGAGGSIVTPSSPTSTFNGVAGTTYVLRWRITNNPCPATNDQVTIVFDAAPTTPDAGPAQVVCSTSTTLAGNAAVTGSGSWSIVSGTGGNIANTASPTSGFTGVTGQTYVLEWAIGNGTCPPLTDQVQIQMVEPPSASNAGPDQTLCGVTSTSLAANTPATGTGLWTVFAGAGGSFGDPTSATSTFSGNAGESYTLRWTISNGPCPAQTDDVSVNFEIAPTIPNAGTDQDVCGLSTTLAGNTPVTGTGQWTIVSGAGGLIADASNPTSSFSGVSGETYILEWTISNGTCAPLSDQVQIILNAPPSTADAGADQVLCGVTSTTLAANTPAVGTGLWTIVTGAGGSFADASNPATGFTGSAGITYTLQWTITNGSCPAQQDQVSIVFDSAPTLADAGPDQQVCGTAATLAANTPASGTGTWSIISGAGGTITDPANPTSGFTGTAGTTYILEWTISSGSCAPSTDQVTIEHFPEPSAAQAGADQDLCTTSTTLAATAPAVGTGAWSIQSGAGGSLGNTGDPLSAFSGAAGQTYVLRWTVSNGVCPVEFDEVQIIINNVATTADAGPDQVVCGSATLAANVPLSGTGLWTIESGTGGAFADASNPATSFTGTAGQSYTLRWTITNGPCTSSDDVTIDVSDAAVVADAGPDKTICGSASLEGNAPAPGSGAWTVTAGAGGTFVDPTSPTTSFSGVAGTVYTLTWTITSGACTTSDDVVITIDNNSPPPANAGPDEEVCATSTILNANDSAPGTGLWSIISGTGGTIITPASPNSQFDGVAGQVYVLQWEISNGVIGCSPTTDLVTISFPDLPTLSNAGPNQDVCGTTTTLAANTPTSGTGSWSIVTGTGGSFSDPASPVSDFNGVAGQTYELSWTIANACGTSSSSVMVRFEDLLSTPVAGPDQTVCGTATLAANTPAIGTGSWSIAAGTGGSISDPANPASTFTGTPGVTYTLRWTITNGGCFASDDVDITIDPAAPTPADAGPDQEVCAADTQLQGNAPGAGSTGAWTVVSGTGFTISAVDNPQATFGGLPGTTYELRWRISSGCGFLEDFVFITFNELPTTPDAGADKTVCGPTTLEANAPVTGTGSWSIVSGTGGVIADPADPLSAFNGTGGEAYTLRWTIISGACTPLTDDVIITFDSNSPTTADAGPDQTVCSVSTTLGANTPVIGSGQWTIISGAGGAFVSDTDPASVFNGVGGETYVLRWTITSGTLGCADSFDEVAVTLDNAAPIADAGADQTVCGPLANVNASASSPATGTWSVVSGTGGSFTDPSAAVTDFNGIPGNVYVLQYTISSACGDVSDQVTITLEENPTDAFAGFDKTICGTEQLEADPVFIGTGAWSIVAGAGGILGNPSDPNSNFTGVAGTVYTLRWTTSNGTCSDKTDDVDITIDINSPSIADAGADQALCGTSTTLAANTPAIGTGSWSVISGAGGSFTDSASPTSDFTGVAGTSYILRWSISSPGCASPTIDDVRVQFDDVPSIADAGADQQGCETSYTLAAATPTSGTGVWTIISGAGGGLSDPADPAATFTGVSGEAYVLEWTVSNTCGTSVDQANITINAAPTTADAGPDQVICAAVFATLAGNTPTSGTGFWTIVSGAGGSVVTPSSPSSQFIGINGSSYTLRWVISNGLCAPSFDDVVINFSASPTVTSPVTVCQNAAAPALTVNATGATSFNWYYYTDPSDPLTRTALATTSATHTPGAELNTAVVGSLTYEVEAVYTCGNSPAIQIVVNVSNTGACGGGGGNCPALTSIPITPTLTTCADPDNGALLFTLPGSYDVTIQNEIFKTNPASPDAVNNTERGTTVDFDGLKAGKYFYTISDLAGTVCVTDFEYTLEKETVVQVTSEVANENVTCFGEFSGSVTLGATGTTTGRYFYEFTHDGNTVSGEFTPGSPISGIPATDNDYLVIKLDESAAFACPDTVMVRLQHLFPQITYTIDKTNVTECNGFDGSITLSNVQGGNGVKRARLMLVATPAPIVVRDFDELSVPFPGVGSGSYFVEVMDENGCVSSSADNPTVIGAPGAIDFSVAKIADADCLNNGKSGVISINFVNPGNYQIGISTSQVIEPAQYVSYSYNAGDPPVIVDTLSRGSYFVFVKPAAGNVCPSTRPTGAIEGAYAISFEVQRVCFAEIQPTVNLINVVGQPDAMMTVEVYRLSNLSEKVDEFTVPIASIIPITYQGEPAGSPHTWLIQPDTYVIRAFQNQSFCPGEPTTPSYEVTFAATQPMTLAIENIRQSLPEPRQTGGFMLKTVVGGSPLRDEDGRPYFNASLLDPSSNTPIIENIQIFRNAQGNYQHDFRNLPVGNYLVLVVDNNGCEVSTLVIVPADTRILIPNIFTPNNDTVNDLFEVVNLPEGAKHKLVITNRWGKQVYSSGDYREGNFWDAEGEPDGIYFYRLQVEGDKTYNGWVEVLRGSKP